MALDRVESLEETLSYFRPTSEITRLNRLAAHGGVEVDADLFALLSLAMKVCADTGGAYDITSAPLWEAWGFARRAGQLPQESQLADARSRVGSHFVELDAQRRTVRFLRPGVQINLGSIGKGHAVDGCLERLSELGLTDVLVHAGQSSVRASGSLGGDGWRIGIGDSRRPGWRLGEIRLRDRGLGTSSLQFQSFRHGGQPIRAHPRSADRPARHRRALRNRTGPHRRAGRRPLDRFFRHGARGVAGLLSGPSGDRHGAAMPRRARRCPGFPVRDRTLCRAGWGGRMGLVAALFLPRLPLPGPNERVFADPRLLGDYGGADSDGIGTSHPRGGADHRGGHLASPAGDCVLNPWGALACCVCGAIAGDAIMYWIGYHFGRGVLREHRWWARCVTPKRECQVERMFERHGLKLFFVTRFLVALRRPYI